MHKCRALQGSSNAAGGGTEGTAERKDAQERPLFVFDARLPWRAPFGRACARPNSLQANLSSLKNSPGANFHANPVRGEAQEGAEQKRQ